MADQTKTAPVDEYRVMWTTNKTQKIKKWHDGFLRYHSFNRRMLVYDDARHLVADMYLRDREFLGEGDQLEFEHHLVSIEDFNNSVNQDLTPLFSPAIQRKQAAMMASAAQTPVSNRRRDIPGAPRGEMTGAQSARQQRPPTRGSYTPATVQGGNRNGLGNGHITTPSRPAQQPATVPRMNGHGNGNGAMNLNTPGRPDYPPVAGPRDNRQGDMQGNGPLGMYAPGPQARSSGPDPRGNVQANRNTNTNTSVRNPSSHNSYPARQHVVYTPQANERPVRPGGTESPVPRRAPPPAPPQPALGHQNHNMHPVVSEEVARSNAQPNAPRPHPPPQRQIRNELPERERPGTTGRLIPAQANRSSYVTRTSPPMSQGVPRPNQNHPIPQRSESPARRRYSPPAHQQRGHPTSVSSRAPVPAPAPMLAEEPAIKAPVTISKIRQFSAPSRARPPRQPTAPAPARALPKSPETIQVPSSAVEHPPPQVPRSPPPNGPVQPPLQKRISIPNSRSPSPTRNRTSANRPSKRASTDANQPPPKRKTQFQSARALAAISGDIRGMDAGVGVDEEELEDSRPIQPGAGVIKLSSGPKKKMLLCARPPTFKFSKTVGENGSGSCGGRSRERPKTVVDEEDYEWDDELMGGF